MAFDYGLPAELFMAKRKGGARSRLISRRFTAAEAIRFAVEDFPAIRALGAWMQVGTSASMGKTSIAFTRATSFLDAESTRLTKRLTVADLEERRVADCAASRSSLSRNH